MLTAIDHPDALTDWMATKEIHRGGMQAIEDKAIAAYHKATDEGRDGEEEFFKHFNKRKDVRQ